MPSTSYFFLLAAFAADTIFGAAVPHYVARHNARSSSMPGLKLYNGDVKTSSYIVKVAATANRDQHISWANQLVANSSVSDATSVTAYDPNYFNAYAADLDDDAVTQLLQSPDVSWVEEDGIMSTLDSFQNNATWGLERISFASPIAKGSNPNSLNFNYEFNPAAGSGVDVYVIDSGVRATHNEYQGRATNAFIAQGLNKTDDNGHGSHVAGTIGGKTFGVAKKVNLLAVKVMDSEGRGLTSNILAGLNFAVSSAQKSGRPSVISMSIGGDGSAAMDNAAAGAVAAGLHVVVAAGNNGTDASNDSPARANGVITVGAMNIKDQVSTFSNTGPVVDVFAPGENVISCGIASDNASANLSGTSMATPHVSGMVALYLSQHPELTPAQVRSLITQVGIPGFLKNVSGGSPNLLASSIIRQNNIVSQT